MPRQARLDVPSALQHIMVRGTKKADIFEARQVGVSNSAITKAFGRIEKNNNVS